MRNTITDKSPLVKHSLIELKSAQIKINEHILIRDFFWEIKSQENWNVIGPNGSGKSLLAGLLSGRYQSPVGTLQFHNSLKAAQIAIISFASVQESLDREAWDDDSEFNEGGVDHGTSVRDFILQDGELEHIPDHLINSLKLEKFLNTGIKYISNGEMRKAHIVRALLNKPRFILFDAVYEGLDVNSKQALTELIEQIEVQSDIQVIHFIQNRDDISPNCTHLLYLNKLKKIQCGPLTVVSESREFVKMFKEPPPSPTFLPTTYAAPPEIPLGDEIIRLDKVFVSYSDRTIIDQLSWAVHAGEHWGISGPNGAGKTTLLSLISADNPQGYGKDFWLFGRKRGTGESIWDIKKRIGLVTAELQLEYHKTIRVEDVVVSGFFDSIGLYQNAEATHYRIAHEWLQVLGIEELVKLNFESLSYGERRAVLLARALVKAPNILILDEPCQGLDERNRLTLLNTINFLAKNTPMTILYVSHKPEAQLACLTHHLQFIPNDRKTYDYHQETSS